MVMWVWQLRGSFLNCQCVHPQDRLCLDKSSKPHGAHAQAKPGSCSAPSSLLLHVSCVSNEMCIRVISRQMSCLSEWQPAIYACWVHANCTQKQQVLWLFYGTECWRQSAGKWRTGKQLSTSLSHGSGLYPVPVHFAYYQIHQERRIWLIKEKQLLGLQPVQSDHFSLLFTAWGVPACPAHVLISFEMSFKQPLQLSGYRKRRREQKKKGDLNSNRGGRGAERQ